MRIELDHAVGKVPLIASPMKFSETKLEFKNPPPVLGQHTDEVLRGVLRMDDAAIAKLRADGII
jgi:crotonobetainyl-CoA:carnitine CoA-transferase CaiB-like acyl-CoA transferase